LSIDLPKAGEIRKGTIASISQNQILISIGAKSEGVVAGKELEQLTEEERAGFQSVRNLMFSLSSRKTTTGMWCFRLSALLSRSPGKMSKR
jgi:ribosomal protein S1